METHKHHRRPTPHPLKTGSLLDHRMSRFHDLAAAAFNSSNFPENYPKSFSFEGKWPLGHNHSALEDTIGIMEDDNPDNYSVNGSIFLTDLAGTAPPNPDDYVPYSMRPETYIIPVLFAIIFIIGVIGNGTLIVIFLKHRSMRNVPNMYVFNYLRLSPFLQFKLIRKHIKRKSDTREKKRKI